MNALDVPLDDITRFDDCFPSAHVAPLSHKWRMAGMILLDGICAECYPNDAPMG